MCLLKKKNILTHVKMVKETIFKTIAIGADSIAIGERSDPTSNTKKTSMQSWGSVDGKLLTRDFKSTGILF